MDSLIIGLLTYIVTYLLFKLWHTTVEFIYRVKLNKDWLTFKNYFYILLKDSQVNTHSHQSTFFIFILMSIFYYAGSFMQLLFR